MLHAVITQLPFTGVTDTRYERVDFRDRSDRGEKQNVIDQHPEVAKRLQEAFEPWWEAAKKGMVNDLHQLERGNLIGPKMKKKPIKATKKAKREAVRWCLSERGTELWTI